MAGPLRKWLNYNVTHAQTRLLLILTLAVFVLIVSVGLANYYTSKSVLQQELSEPQHQMLWISMKTVDEYIRESDQISIKIALNRGTYRFLTDPNQASYSNITQLVQFMETTISSARYIKSAYIYDAERDSFVAFPQGYSSNRANFSDSGWTEVEERLGSRSMLVEQRHNPAGGENGTDQITLYRKIMISGAYKGLVALNFETSELFSELLPSSVSRLNTRRFILGDNNRLLQTLGGGDIDAGAAEQALTSLGDERLGEIKYSGQRLLASQIISPVTGWRYLSVVSQDSLLANTQKIRNTVILISLAALGAGLAAIFAVNRTAFKPVRRLRLLLSQHGAGKLGSGVLDLEKITGQLLSDHARLAGHLRQTMPEAASKFLTDIYSGNLSGSRETSEKWARYFREWQDGPLIVAMLSVDKFGAWCWRFSKSDHSLMKYAIANMVDELMSGHFRVLTADLGGDRMLVLFQPTAGGTESLKPALEETIRRITDLLKFGLSAGLGSADTGAMRLKQAMLEAEEALSYRLYMGYGQVIPYEAAANPEVAASPREEDRLLLRLKEAVETGSAEEAEKAVDRLLAQVRDGGWHPQAASALLETAAERLERISVECGQEGSLRPEELTGIRTLTLDEAALLLRKQASLLAESFGTRLNSKDYLLCCQMIAFMQQHLEDAVGVQEIAEHTGISVSLASQLFKQEMNETIHGYFTQLRMERACELLVTTDYKISEIASKVGYQHENSFIRVYRKYKDVTPGKYRELMRSQEQSAMES